MDHNHNEFEDGRWKSPSSGDYSTPEDFRKDSLMERSWILSVADDDETEGRLTSANINLRFSEIENSFLTDCNSDKGESQNILPPQNSEDILTPKNPSMDTSSDISYLLDEAGASNIDNQCFKRINSVSLSSNTIQYGISFSENAYGSLQPLENVDPDTFTNDDSKTLFALQNIDYNCWTDDICNSYNSICQRWPDPTVSCYSSLSSQMTDNTFFFVEGSEVDWVPKYVNIYVLDPNNSPVPVEMIKENIPQSRRYVCTYEAQILGIYTVFVCSGPLNAHIKGSPFSISVSRNYKMFSAWEKPRIYFNHATDAWGIAYSSFAKKVYLTDRDTHQIIVYNEDGTLDNYFGKLGTDLTDFNKPTGIAIDDRNQRLIISDKDNHRICFYYLDGEFMFSFGKRGLNDGEFNYPWGVAVSPKDGTIAVADSRNYRIQLFDCYGNFLRKYSVFETNPLKYKTEFNHPLGIAFDKQGENIYVSDFNIHTVFKLNVDLTERTTMMPQGIHFNRPQGITVDAVGNLLICDSLNNCIQVVSPEGEHISSIFGHIVNPQNITVAPTGEIIVVDAYSGVIVF